jgi:NMD protein affecting ribosome stability and mRNA decay
MEQYELRHNVKCDDCLKIAKIVLYSPQDNLSVCKDCLHIFDKKTRQDKEERHKHESNVFAQNTMQE